jgi:hypothetical protein
MPVDTASVGSPDPGSDLKGVTQEQLAGGSTSGYNAGGMSLVPISARSTATAARLGSRSNTWASRSPFRCGSKPPTTSFKQGHGKPKTRRLLHNDFGIVLYQAMTAGPNPQTVRIASYGANPLEFEWASSCTSTSDSATRRTSRCSRPVRTTRPSRRRSPGPPHRRNVRPTSARRRSERR